MCLSCGCMLPDEQHDDGRYIVMQDLVDAAAADGATLEQTWKNLEETMAQVLAGKVKSKAWAPQKRANVRATI